jgi:hypothetical protein
MTVSPEDVQSLVNTLKSGIQENQVQAAMELRNLASEVVNKNVIREAGGIRILLQLLDSGHDNILTTVCAESLACLAADDLENRVTCNPPSIINVETSLESCVCTSVILVGFLLTLQTPFPYWLLIEGAKGLTQPSWLQQ